MQPLEKCGSVIRFRPNLIIRHMLNICRSKGIGINEILTPDYPQRDVEQFYQLIGYGLDMYEELSSVSDRSVTEAKRQAAKFTAGRKP